MEFGWKDGYPEKDEYLEDNYARIDVLENYGSYRSSGVYESLNFDHEDQFIISPAEKYENVAEGLEKRAEKRRSFAENSLRVDSLVHYKSLHVSEEPGMHLYAKVDKSKKRAAREKSAKRDVSGNRFIGNGGGALSDSTKERPKCEDTPKDPAEFVKNTIDKSAVLNISKDLEHLKKEMMDAKYERSRGVGGRGGYRRLPPVCGRSPPCDCPQDLMLASKLRLRNVSVSFL